MNQTIFEGIRGDNKNFIVLLYDFDLCQNSTHGKLHSSKAEQCANSKWHPFLILILKFFAIWMGQIQFNCTTKWFLCSPSGNGKAELLRTKIDPISYFCWIWYAGLLGRWDKWLMSDVPIIFFVISCKTLSKNSFNSFNLFFIAL